MILVVIKCAFYWHYFPSSFPFHLSISCRWRSPLFQLGKQSVFLSCTHLNSSIPFRYITFGILKDQQNTKKISNQIQCISSASRHNSTNFRTLTNLYFIMVHLTAYRYTHTHMRYAKSVVTESE